MIDGIIKDVVICYGSQIAVYCFNRAISYFTGASHPRAKNTQSNSPVELTPEKTGKMMKYFLGTFFWFQDQSNLDLEYSMGLDSNNEVDKLILNNNTNYKLNLNELNEEGAICHINEKLISRKINSKIKVNDHKHERPGYYDLTTGLQFFIMDKYSNCKLRLIENANKRVEELTQELELERKKQASDFKNASEIREHTKKKSDLNKEIRSLNKYIKKVKDESFLIDDTSNDIVISFQALLAQIDKNDSVNYKFRFQMIKAIIAQLLGIKIPTAYTQAAKIVKKIKQAYPEKNIILTGVCYGGSLAQYASLKNGVKAYCFNSMPLGSALQNDIGAKKLKNASLITQISIKKDFVSDMPGIGYIDKFLLALGFETPANFGTRFVIPPAEESYSLYERHLDIKGSMLAHARSRTIIEEPKPLIENQSEIEAEKVEVEVETAETKKMTAEIEAEKMEVETVVEATEVMAEAETEDIFEKIKKRIAALNAKMSTHQSEQETVKEDMERMAEGLKTLRKGIQSLKEKRQALAAI